MTDLIDRIKNAGAGSRGLDIEIHQILGWESAPPEAACAWWNTDTGDTLNGDTPHYTTSLDAALLLVLGGRGWYVYSYDKELGGCEAAIAEDDNPGREKYIASAATPALALVAAALKARGLDNV